jgi:pimeloyl-ACP methyl ester carboxylesterase
VGHRRVIRVQPIHNELGSKGIPGDPAYSAEVERELLRLTLDALDLERSHLAGWSGGGLALIEFAIEYPERVRSLTLVEPAAYWILARLGERIDEVEQTTGFVHGLFGREVSEEELANFLRKRRSRRGGRGRALSPQLGPLGRASDDLVVARPAARSSGSRHRRPRPHRGTCPRHEGDGLVIGRPPRRRRPRRAPAERPREGVPGRPRPSHRGARRIPGHSGGPSGRRHSDSRARPKFRGITPCGERGLLGVDEDA